MNYKKRDDELIKLNKQAQAKANKKSVGNNSGNVGYSKKALSELKSGTYGNTREIPHLKATTSNAAPNKASEMNPKPSTRYQNQTAAKTETKTTRDTKYDKDFDEFHKYRLGDYSAATDYDPKTDTSTEHWRTVKESIKRKNKWSDEEFESRWNAYNDERNKKAANAEVQSAVNTAKKSGVLGTLQQAIYTPQTWIEGASSMLSNLLPEKYKAQSADDTFFTGTRTKEAAKQTVKDEHIKSTIGKGAYDIGTSVADMALASAVPFLGAATLGTETAARTNMNALERGVDPNKAAATAGIAGLASGILNKVGLDKAVNATGKTALSRLGQAALTEGAENIAEDSANYIADTLINKDKSQLGAMHDYYVSQGMSDDEAWNQVRKDTLKDYATSFGSGALFGGFMNGVRNIPELKAELTDVFGELDNKGFVNLDVLLGKKPELNELISRDPSTFSEAERGEIVARKKDTAALLKQKNAEIKAQEEVYANATKKNRDAEYQRLDALKKEAEELRLEKKVYDYASKGKTVPIKNRISESDYISIYGEHARGKKQKTGLFDHIGFAQKFAGDTPEAKQLASEAKQSIEKFIETRNWDYLTEAKRKSEALDNLARETDAPYGEIRYADYFTDDTLPSILATNTGVSNAFSLGRKIESDAKAGESAPKAEEGYGDKALTPEEIQALKDGMNMPDEPEIPQRVPEVVPTEPTPIQNVPEVVQNNSIIARMMAQGGGGNNNNVPPGMEDNSVGNGKHTKTSQAYTNTGKYGGGWNEAEYEKHTDESMFQYEDKSERESFEQGYGMWQDEGRDGFKNRVMDKERLTGAEIDGLMVEWRVLTREARALEAAGQDASDLWKESVNVFRKIQTQSTSNAQALQALAKWSRNTPEGMLSEAERIINEKQKKGKPKKSEDEKILDKFAKRNKDFHFSEEFIKEFLKDAEEIQKYPPDSPMANKLMAQLGRKINSQVPSTIGEKFTTYLMDNMLGNFRTLITRNAGGNVGLNAVEQLVQRPVAAGIDMLASKKTGKRTQAGLTREGLAEYINGFAKGLKDEASDVKTGLHTARTGENNLERAISSNRHVYGVGKGLTGNNILGRTMDKWDSLIKNGLSVGDRPFYEAVYKQTLGDYNRLRNAGLMGVDVQKLSNEQFKEYAETAAKMNALAAVYQNDSKLSDAMLGLKKNIGKLSEGLTGVDILSQFSMPFVKTPANVVDVGIQYSPLGLIRNAVNTGREIANDSFNQNRFANETARNILGTAGAIGAAGLAKEGILSGGYSEDQDEKQAQKESGMQEYALNIGDKQMDISWLPVVGSNAVAAAAAYDAFKNGKGNLADNLMEGAYAGGKAMFDQSMFQGMQRLFGTGETYNSDKGIVGNMADVVTSGVSQIIPSLARQTGQVIDPYQRDIGNSNEGVSLGLLDNYKINSLANTVPGLRQNVLAPKVDTSGELMKENQGRNIGSKILEDMILPGKITKVEYSDLNKEAIRLKEATDSADAYMPKASRQYVDTDEHTLTNQEWVEYQQKYYKELTSVGTKIMSSKAYQGADAEQQLNLMKNCYTAVRQAINSEYTGKELTGAAKKYVEAGGGEKGVKAVVDDVISSQFKKSAGVSSNSKAGKEIDELVKKGNVSEAEKKANAYGANKEKTDAINEKYGTDMSVTDYLKKQADYEGGAEQYAKDRQAAEKAGIVDKNGHVQTDDYGKIMERAGKQSAKMERDLPALSGMGLPKTSYYVYANAINYNPSIQPATFAKTYNAIDTNKENGMTQNELLAYINKNYANDYNAANEIWNTYGEWTNKKGQHKKIKQGKNGYTAYY